MSTLEIWLTINNILLLLFVFVMHYHRKTNVSELAQRMGELAQCVRKDCCKDNLLKDGRCFMHDFHPHIGRIK